MQNQAIQVKGLQNVRQSISLTGQFAAVDEISIRAGV